MNSKKNSSDIQLNLENYRHPDQFGKWLGYQLIKMDLQKHEVEVELKIREDHLSPANRVHGGVVSAFFDFACGAAVFSSLGPHDLCSTVEIKVNYLRPIELGDRLTAKVSIVYRGKRICVLHGYAYRNDMSEPIAMVSATFNVVAGKSKNPEK